MTSLSNREDLVQELRDANNELALGRISSAFEKYMNLADLGFEPAFFEIGNALEFGLGGVERDITEAVRWYEKAINSSKPCSAAHLGLGRILISSENHSDRAKALAHFEAVKHEEMGANFALGLAFQLGIGTKANEDMALEYYLRAAEMGHIHAAVNAAKLRVKPGPLRKLREIIAAKRVAGRLLKEHPDARGKTHPRIGVFTTWDGSID